MAKFVKLVDLSKCKKLNLDSKIIEYYLMPERISNCKAIGVCKLEDDEFAFELGTMNNNEFKVSYYVDGRFLIKNIVIELDLSSKTNLSNWL